MAERPVAVLIVGMHRSGTSAVTRVLNLCGAHIGSYLLPPSDNNNEKGFWEHVEAVDIHSRLLDGLGMAWDDQRRLPPGWAAHPAAVRARGRIGELIDREFNGKPLWAVKDPRICRFIPLWLEVLEQRGIDVRLLFVLRDPREVAASLAKRDGLLPAETQMLSLHHFFEAAAASVGCVRSVITYPQLLTDRAGSMRRIAAELGVALTSPGKALAAEIDAFLDVDARHHTIESVGTNDRLLERIYRYASEAAGNTEFWAKADALQSDYQLVCDEALPLVEVLYGLNRDVHASDTMDATHLQSQRLHFRIVRGLQVNVERLGQASADLGQMIRLGSEATSDLKVDFTRFSAELGNVSATLARIEVMRSELAAQLQQQLGEAREAQAQTSQQIQNDLQLRLQAIAQVAEKISGGQTLAHEVQQQMQAAIATQRQAGDDARHESAQSLQQLAEALRQQWQASTQSVEQGNAQLRDLLAQVIARNEQVDGARFSQRLRRLFQRR